VIDLIAAATDLGTAEQPQMLIQLLIAAGLLLAAVVFLILEVLVVSFGVLAVLALALAVGAIVQAFAAGDAAGWTFIVVTPILGAAVVAWGLRRLEHSRIVSHAVIGGHSGASGIAERLQIATGSRGRMLTDAYPSGRARFPGGVCDVQVEGGSLERDTPIIITGIDGPMIYVVAETHASDTADPAADSTSS